MRDAGPLTDYTEARPRQVRIGDRDVAVVRWRGEFYASGNRCPHMMARLCLGTVEATLSADRIGSYTADMARPVLVCPWHGWQFDLRTGESLGDARVRVRTFRTECRDGHLLIDTE